MALLTEIVRYTDDYLRIHECGDWANALNGLQVENSGQVQKIGAAVDASSRTFAVAGECGVDFLLVHHGLFWPGLQPVTATFRRQLNSLLTGDIALYSAHLPLDIHPVVGNNAQLAAALDLGETEPFLEMKSEIIGLKARKTVPREELLHKLDRSLGGPARLFGDGPAETASIGVITGGAGSEIYAVARAGIDTFITGEGPHWAAVAAAELGVNLILGGHYATETFGVKALAQHLSRKFDLPWEFLDLPSGL